MYPSIPNVDNGFHHEAINAFYEYGNFHFRTLAMKRELADPINTALRNPVLQSIQFQRDILSSRVAIFMSVLASGSSSLDLSCCYVGTYTLAGTRTQSMYVSVIQAWEQFPKYNDQDRHRQMGEEIDETDDAALARQRRKTLEQKRYFLSAIRVRQDSKPLEDSTEALADVCFKPRAAPIGLLWKNHQRSSSRLALDVG
ncbi:hypothetical protein LTR66_000879 [Elasticomyces elasticus]|nr:hypothetical protein LTR66_000879 [Elasticomyces elasticus]